MEKNESPVYWALFALSLAFSVLALVTLVPNGAASKPNVLGYRVQLRPDGHGALRPARRDHLHASQPHGLVAGVFGIRFGIAQSRFGAIRRSVKGKSRRPSR